MQHQNATHDGRNDSELCGRCKGDKPAYYRVDATGEAVCKAHALAFWTGREDGQTYDLTSLRFER